jgi:hypothetical protein
MAELRRHEKAMLKKEFAKTIDNFKGHKQFPAILLEMIKVHSDKSNDYATDKSPFSNIELSERVGFPAWKGVIVRLGDKFSRLLNALSGKLFKFESVEDAFLDLANYGIIGLIEYRKAKKRRDK